MTADQCEANKRIVSDFLATFSRGDVVGVLSAMHRNGIWWVSGSKEGFSGNYPQDQLGELLREVNKLYKKAALQITPKAMIAEGDRVAVEAESYAELKDGRIYNNTYHFLFVIENEKVKTVREYMDTAHAYETFLPDGGTS